MNRTNRILVVDDDEVVRSVFVKILRGRGYEVSEAATGRQALQLTREERPDVVLLDVRLPDLSGLEVCRQIKGDANLQDVFVALCSGEATSSENTVDGLAAGADEYVTKPVNPEELLARMRTLERLRDSIAGLRASEQHFRRLVDILPDAVCLIDPQGRLLAMNPQGMAMLGYDSSTELPATSLFELTPKEDHDRVRAHLATALEAGILRNADCTLLRKNGDRFPAEWSASASPGGNGQPAALVSVMRDITRRKRTDEELRQMPRQIIEAQEVERLRVARELHDGVNQLIASVKMRLRKVDASLAGTSPAAHEILSRCNKLLVQALEENRRIAHNLHPTDLDNLGLADACRNLCRDLQSRTNLKVKCQINRVPEWLPPALELNLFRIIQEAMTNVEKHARAKSLHARLVFQQNSVVLKIQDDGRGFDPKRAKVGKGKWRGIGLTNMRERAASLGGTCEVKPAPDHGTTVTVCVPLQQREP